MNGKKTNSMYPSISIVFGGLAKRHRAPIKRGFSQNGAIRYKLPRLRVSGVYPEGSLGRLSTAILGRSALHKIGRSLPISSISIILLLFISCSTEPEQLVYGTDVCQFCKMTLMDKKFGAELVTKKGKVYKFDDMNCFLNFYNSAFEDTENYQHKLVVDFASEGKLIDATHAFYIKSSAIRSPMDGQVAAFETKASMDKFKKEWKGIYLAWGEVITQYK
jgi:copper chaperone NosL